MWKRFCYVFFILLIFMLLTSCKSRNSQGTLKIYPDYIAKGFVEITSNKMVSKYFFFEQRINGKVEAEFQKDKRKIKITKENGKVILEGKDLKNIAEDIFLEYYIDKLINSEKYSIVKQEKSTIITIELKDDIRYLHYYFEDERLKKIVVIYQDARFIKTIYLTEYKKYRKG
ncbi:hypothetical protein [Caldicellulosiruptor sp. F32]|uniref:hypothetical protein n=1 Tax=Caldicellulosiruptor sp. F32 TaxID=1214564 RepID=UPI00039B84B3|nr:hypothetical protein [Caldicellulosiruptor sp. F32]